MYNSFTQGIYMESANALVQPAVPKRRHVKSYRVLYHVIKGRVPANMHFRWE